jgi:SET domain-containing protein
MFALPREMACDTSEWMFTQRFDKDGPMRIVSSLNIAILMNEGDNQTEVNVEPENDYSSVLRAMRDIKEGEEILMDYSDYPTEFNKAFAFVAAREKVNDEDYLRQGEKRSC